MEMKDFLEGMLDRDNNKFKISDYIPEERVSKKDDVDLVLEGLDEISVENTEKESEEIEIVLEDDTEISLEPQPKIKKDLFEGYLGELNEAPNPLEYGANATYRNLREGIVYKKGPDNLWEVFVKDGAPGRQGPAAPGGGCGVTEVKNIVENRITTQPIIANYKGSPANPFATDAERTAWATANLASLRSGVTTAWGPGNVESVWNGPLATDWVVFIAVVEDKQKRFETALRSSGVFGGGVFDCAPGINAALDAVAPDDADGMGVTLTLPSGNYYVSTPVYIPNRVILRGFGKRGNSAIIQKADASGLGTIVLGRASDVNTFDCRIEKIRIVGADTLIPVLYANKSQEGSGFSNILFANIKTGVRITNNCANMHYDDIEFNYIDSTASEMFHVANTIPGGANRISRVTCDGPTGSQIARAMYFGGGSWEISNINFENTVIGLELAQSSSAVVSNLLGGELTTTVFKASHANFVAHHLTKGVATNTLVDLGSSGLAFTDPFIETFIPKTIFLGGVKIFDYHTNPEGLLTARPGSIALNHAGGAGATLYVKESGNGNTGWVAK